MRKLSVVVVVMGLMACPPPKMDTCGGQVCSETQYCDTGALLCREDERPVVKFDAVTDVVTQPTVLVTGKITDDVGVIGAEWFAGTDQPQAFEVAADGTFAITVPTPALDAQPLLVSVRARDRLGATLQSTQMIVDRVGPTITVVSPRPTDVLNASEVSVTARATDGSNSLGTLIIAGRSTTSPTVNTEVTVSVPVDGGFDYEPLSFNLEATDSRGNKTTQKGSVIIDNTAPVVTLTAPATPDMFVTTATFTASATVSDGSGVLVDFQLGSGVPVRATQSSPGVWSAELTIPTVEAAEAVTVTVEDLQGNRTVVSRPVRIDRVGPTLTITTPAVASIHRNDIAVSVTATADATRVTASLGATPVVLTNSGTTWSGTLTIPAGDFTARTLTVVATDSAMNEGSATVNVSTDTVAPVVTITAPMAAQKFKASDFLSGNTVAVTWTVTDGDTSAATTIVDGSPFTGNTSNVTTSATDNPVTYSRNIVAADRAGNTASASVQFSVDRVAPTVISWTPNTNSRNVTGNTVITFSEPVFGLGMNDAPFSITGLPTPGGGWNAQRTTFTMALSPLVYRALTLTTLNVFADAHGNPIPTQTKAFHTATSLPDGTLLTGVASFSAASDTDGVLSVYVVKPSSGCTGTCVNLGTGQVHRDTGGSMTAVASNISTVASTGWLNVWNTVNSVTLQSSPSFGLLATRNFDGPIQVWGPTSSAALPNGATGAVISRPPLFRESGGDAHALVTGDRYRRGTAEVVLPRSPTGLVSVSSTHASMFSVDASAIRFARLWCASTLTVNGPRDACAAADYSIPAASATNVNAVSTLSGSCEAVTFVVGSDRRYSLLAKPAHENPNDLILVPAPQVLGSASLPNHARNARFARYVANGEDTLVYTDYGTGTPVTGVQIRKMTGCAISSNDPVVATGGPPFTEVNDTVAPIQIGQKLGVIWLQAGEVKLWVQP